MFEKEAEEYAENRDVCYLLDSISEDLQNYDYGAVAKYDIDPLTAECFKDGAEFGYNKAKEEDKWHKVHIMEGFVDLPDEERTYLCCLQDGDEYMYEVLDICIDGNGGCYLSSMVWTIDELIAWKEITPPKED